MFENEGIEEVLTFTSALNDQFSILSRMLEIVVRAFTRNNASVPVTRMSKLNS